jgi:hypothetical protein
VDTCSSWESRLPAACDEVRNAYLSCASTTVSPSYTCISSSLGPMAVVAECADDFFLSVIDCNDANVADPCADLCQSFAETECGRDQTLCVAVCNDPAAIVSPLCASEAEAYHACSQLAERSEYGCLGGNIPLPLSCLETAQALAQCTAEHPEEICGDQLDNDGDGFADEECGTEICGDGTDNDGDGEADEDCAEICGDGIDNDGDGEADEEADCPEFCYDLVDNDGDGNVDEGCPICEQTCVDAIDALSCGDLTGCGLFCERIADQVDEQCRALADAYTACAERVPASQYVCAEMHYPGFSDGGSQPIAGGCVEQFAAAARCQTCLTAVEICGNGQDDTCEGDVDEGCPAGWNCAAAAYGDGYCDCGCGVVDLDCEGASSDACAYCDAVGACSTSCAQIDPNDNAACL